MNFLNYMLKQSNVEAARNLYNYASAKLDLELIRCRLAEIQSQAEPLSKYCKDNKNNRDDLIAIAFWVVVGRFPAEGENR